MFARSGLVGLVLRCCVVGVVSVLTVPQVGLGGVLSSLQRPPFVASLLILAPDQAVRISHHGGLLVAVAVQGARGLGWFDLCLP
jgi:hypothetical protein